MASYKITKAQKIASDVLQIVADVTFDDGSKETTILSVSRPKTFADVETNILEWAAEAVLKREARAALPVVLAATTAKVGAQGTLAINARLGRPATPGHP